jgi:hypothetical protein
MKSILVHLEEKDYQRLVKAKEKLNLTWLDVLERGLKEKT